MAKKLQRMNEKQFSQRIKDSAHQIWLAGLGAFAKAQAEGGKLFDNLVQEGREIEARTRQVASEKVVALKDRAGGTFDKLEQVFEDRVSRALNRLGVPTHEDVQELARRVEELTRSVQALLESQESEGEKKSARTRAAKSDEMTGA
ncbi:MAG TPA: phasin family protein [Candidatus Competibacteraceae bacterium]|nr:phasin family protein [Candidatus Competibacteraceae bacterium]